MVVDGAVISVANIFNEFSEKLYLETFEANRKKLPESHLVKCQGL